MTPFQNVQARAEHRKGGAEKLKALLPAKTDAAALAVLSDDRVLAEMAKRIFSAGFAWSVIENKWPGFETAFLGFAPGRLTLQPDEFWDRLLIDKRIVRNGAKIMAVRTNAFFVAEIAREYGGFGKLLAQWPASDQATLLDLLAKRGARLGGNTGPMLLRFLGYDGFTLSKDVITCLRDAGVDIPEAVKSKRDLAKMQAQFSAWAEETGLGYAQMSRICALSVGENYTPEELRARMGGGE